MLNTMPAFLKKLSIFTLPLILIFAFPIIVIFLGREYYSASDALDVQTAAYPETLFYMAESNHVKYYKSLLVSRKNPEILALGTSRVMSFRKEFFKNPESFANASNAVSSVFDMQEFMDSVSADKIKIMILGLDQNMFKEGYPTIHERDEVENDYTRAALLVVDSWRSVYRQYSEGKFTLRGLIESRGKTKNIGLNAIVNKVGFREDGSLHKNLEGESDHRASIQKEIDAELVAMRENRGSFLYGKEKISEDVLATLEVFLQKCKERGIYVIGFFPPYANALYKEMSTVDDIYKERMNSLPQEIRKTLAAQGFDFYDFSDIRPLGGNDAEFADVKHGSDKLYLRMVIHMAQKNRELGKYVDIPALRKMLRETNKDYLEG